MYITGLILLLLGVGRYVLGPINGMCSPVLPISRGGIIQGSGVGPTFYIILKSDLNPLSANNVLSKYADDLNLLVLQHCDVSLATEFDHIRKWADDNKMTINTTKTKEIVLRLQRRELMLLTNGVFDVS